MLAKLIVQFSYMKCYPVNNKSFQNLTRNTEHGSGTVTLSLSNIDIALLVLFSVVHLSRSEGEGLGLGFMVETIPGDGFFFARSKMHETSLWSLNARSKTLMFLA